MSELLKPGSKLTHEKLLEQSPDLWQPEYGKYSVGAQISRLNAVKANLDPQYTGDTEFEEACEATQIAVEDYFAEYHGTRAFDTPGSFAFVVPTRIERKAPGQDDEYASEIDTLFPLLRYTDISAKQVFMAGMCPFVVDRYHAGNDGRAGAIVFAPVLNDIKNDIPDLGEAFGVMTQIMNDTTDFAKNRLGVDIVSFAAMLPRLTNYGQTIKTPDLVTTTGHGATADLVIQALEYARDRGFTRDGTLDRVGIIGTGAIGAATARALLEKGITDSVVLTDVNWKRGINVQSFLLSKYQDSRVNFSTLNEIAINNCNATVSAAATRFDIETKEWERTNFEGAWIVDDSQPGAFSMQQIERAGGNVVWPIGLDDTDEHLGTLEDFEYGGTEQLKTGPAAREELFGCEAEVVTLYASGEYDQAINTAVKPDQVISIGSLMKQVGIGLAEPQCLGRYVTKNQPSQ